MLKLLGFLLGVMIAIFIIQPWVANNYPVLYKRAKLQPEQQIRTFIIDKKSSPDRLVKESSPEIKENKHPLFVASDEVSLLTKTDEVSLLTKTNEVSQINQKNLDKSQQEKSSLLKVKDEQPKLAENKLLEQSIISQVIWSPFRYKDSAKAFVKQIRERAHIVVYIEQNNNKQYQLVLKSSNQELLQQQMANIEKALGLQLIKFKSSS